MEQEAAVVEQTAGRPRRLRRRRSVGAIIMGVVAEILLTVGLFVLLFIGWQLWWTNIEAGSSQKNAINEVTEDWGREAQSGDQSEDQGEPSHPLTGQTWGILYIPSFGEGYAKPLAEGVEMDVLNSVGVGHYPKTQMPGEKGNTAFAGHRQTHGQVFWDMDKLNPGDTAYIQTKEGIYSYKMRDLDYVQPSESQVLWPVPGDEEAEAEDKLMTLTTCHPPFSTAERIIAQFEQTTFTAAGKPAPQEIAETVKKTTGGNT